RSGLVKVLGLGGGVLLLLGVVEPTFGRLAAPSVALGPLRLNALEGLGHLAVIAAGLTALFSLGHLPRTAPPHAAPAPMKSQREEGTKVKLGDLAVLSFIASMVFMALEMVAGRLVTRHLGSSVFGWTSVIGVLLGGLSLGNYLGGKIADWIRTEKQASHLFLLSSVFLVTILIAESPPVWLVRNPIGWMFQGESPAPLIGDGDVFLRQAISMTGYSWWFRVLFWTSVVFFLPALSLGTVSPIVAKLAVERHRQNHRTGSAIGQVYAWGMVGSIVGTFLTGFVLIDWLGTKGVVIVLSTIMALSATVLGSLGHAAWAGVPLGLCVLAFLPGFIPDVGFLSKLRMTLSEQSLDWGLREKTGDPSTIDGDLAYTDESNYYFIKVDNENNAEGHKRTLVLDNLIHGYEFLGQPRKLDYTYEHIYALVTDRLMKSKAGEKDGPPPGLTALFLGGGSYTFPRYLQAMYPKVRAEVAEIDPAVTLANHIALGLPWPDRTLPEPRSGEDGNDVVTIRGETIVLGPHGSPEAFAAYLESLRKIAPGYSKDPETGQAASRIDGQVVRFGEYGTLESAKKYLDVIGKRYAESPYVIRTTWGDARRYVVNHQKTPFDIVYGDAFNDFSVPWHLTTREFNEKLDHILTPEGVYMINIIDVYESDEHAADEGPYHALSNAIAPIVKAQWSGKTSVQKLSDDLADVVPGLEWTRRFRGVSEAAAKVLEADQRPMTREQLLQAVQSAVVPEPVVQNVASLGAAGAVPEPTLKPRTEDEMAVSASTILSNARAREVLSKLDEAGDHLRQRYAGHADNNLTLLTLLRILEAVRGAAYPDDSASDRAKVIDETLERVILTARSVGKTSPLKLPDELERQRLEVEAKVPRTLSESQGQALVRLLEGITQTANREAARGSNELGSMLGFDTALKMSDEIADRLDAVREEIREQSRAILDNARNDDKIAEQVAATVHQFTQSRTQWDRAIADSVFRARGLGGFLGSWVETARKTFPHIKVYGTDSEPGVGDRETFVVVVSRKPLDLDDLGGRPDDLEFDVGGARHMPEAYSSKHMKALTIRSRGIILTDDYAPVENLLAPVAETRGDE
ncbi:MAG TPA: fused MFS/spermidine synthase, partial [Isosphaeraceae bacterium]|nr:fused MFS/spermidine synthase [Isosphaeraceae bacterium]